MIGIDIAEPDKMEKLISQSVETYRATLNIESFADYLFTDSSGQLIQIEKEPTSAILGNMLSIEDEVDRHRVSAHHTILLEVGLGVPVAKGTKVLPYKNLVMATRYETYIAWRHELYNNGIEHIQVLNDSAAAIAIVSIYNNCRKPEHNMFHRYVKPFITWHPDPAVRSIMGIVGANVGEHKAKQLVERFGSLQGLCNCKESDLLELDGWGKKSAEKLLKAIGR